MEDRHEEMRQQVIEFNREHPEVWRYFCWFTFGMINKGFANYSVNAIFERIRWEIDAGGNGVTSFKLNNNYRAFYARRLCGSTRSTMVSFVPGSRRAGIWPQ
jgi:hypothetical protein